MDEVAEIRKRKLEELQRAQQNAVAQDFINQQIEGVKKTVLQRYLTKEARERLGNVRIGNPMVAEQVELALFEAVQAGQIREQIDDSKLKEILSRVSAKKGFKIIR
ncbi:MAG: DNA-binding protein [archaeon]